MPYIAYLRQMEHYATHIGDKEYEIKEQRSYSPALNSRYLGVFDLTCVIYHVSKTPTRVVCLSIFPVNKRPKV